MFSKMPVADVGQSLCSVRHLMCRISFEGRSLVIPKALKGNQGLDIVAFASKKRTSRAHQNVISFLQDFPTAEITSIDIDDPNLASDTLLGALRASNKRHRGRDTLVDISSFRREELLILVAALQVLNIPQSSNSFLGYVSASKMANDWLSRNVISHRSVLGYAGKVWPSRNTTLILMMGFELERARSIIENYEPSVLIVGTSRREEAINEELHTLNMLFFDALKKSFSGRFEKFEFSARDPNETEETLSALANDYSDSNVIIAPLHTKLSTIGAGICALKNPWVQVCYAQVDEYNEGEYSTSGSDVYIVPVSDLLIHKQKTARTKV